MVFLLIYVYVCVFISLSSFCLPVSFPSASLFLYLTILPPLLDFFKQYAECCSNHRRVPQSLHISKLMKEHGEKMLADTQKCTSSHTLITNVAALCIFTLFVLLVSGFKRRYTFVLPFHRLFFFSAWLMFILPLNWRVCPCVCLQEIGAWQSVFDILLELLMMTFLSFLYIL